jgi:electron transport complex protein RnfD
MGIVSQGEDALHAVTQASPLSETALQAAVTDSPMYSYFDLITGTVSGCLGEVSKILLIIGGFYLIYRKYVNWRVPFFYILTVAVLVYLLPGKKIPSQGFFSGDVMYHVFSGGLILGAFYMATDMVTTPITNKGLITFGIGCGVLTAVIRLYGGYPEGVCYSILLMNTATPLIDRIFQPKVFGARKKK